MQAATSAVLLIGLLFCTVQCSLAVNGDGGRCHPSDDYLLNVENGIVDDWDQEKYHWDLFNTGAELLFCFTTCNHIELAQMVIENLRRLELHGLVDVLVVDDHSVDGTAEWLAEQRIRTLRMKKGFGVTHAWNKAYGYFIRSKRYRSLIVANDDIVIPHGSLEPLVEALRENEFVVPVANKKGTFYAMEQAVFTIHGQPPQEVKAAESSMTPEAVQMVQDYCEQRTASLCEAKQCHGAYVIPNPRLDSFNGFFWGVAADHSATMEYSPGHLFNYNNIIFSQEQDLAPRLAELEIPIMIVPNSYVFHMQGQTVNTVRKAKLGRYHQPSTVPVVGFVVSGSLHCTDDGPGRVKRLAGGENALFTAAMAKRMGDALERSNRGIAVYFGPEELKLSHNVDVLVCASWSTACRGVDMYRADDEMYRAKVIWIWDGFAEEEASREVSVAEWEKEIVRYTPNTMLSMFRDADAVMYHAQSLEGKFKVKPNVKLVHRPERISRDVEDDVEVQRMLDWILSYLPDKMEQSIASEAPTLGGEDVE